MPGSEDRIQVKPDSIEAEHALLEAILDFDTLSQPRGMQTSTLFKIEKDTPLLTVLETQEVIVFEHTVYTRKDTLVTLVPQYQARLFTTKASQTVPRVAKYNRQRVVEANNLLFLRPCNSEEPFKLAAVIAHEPSTCK